MIILVVCLEFVFDSSRVYPEKEGKEGRVGKVEKLHPQSELHNQDLLELAYKLSLFFPISLVELVYLSIRVKKINSFQLGGFIVS